MRLSEYRARFVQVVNDSNYWLLGIAVGLIALHLQLYWRLTGNFSHISLELIGWSAVFYSLWHRRHDLMLQRSPISQFAGWFLIAILLVRGANLRGAQSIILGVTPLFIGLAIALISVGFKQFKHYQRELWLILIMAIPTEFLVQFVDRMIHSTVLTAKYAHTLMWYLGFLVERKGTQLVMPSGAVDIYLGCSGLEAAIVSVKVALFFLLVYPTRLREKILVPTIAILSAFVINGFRVIFLAYLVSKQDTASFEYWHGDQGAQIFSMISMTILTTYCQILMERGKPEFTPVEPTPEELEQSSR
ncbi:cyanoexosortase A [Leptolyngbya sp. AN03gr2]|uniref:cyanoexosortase A n=1 Tax=unclassified Leptolyngbya TaxID=2650499 RepID=UPI003D3231AF